MGMGMGMGMGIRDVVVVILAMARLVLESNVELAQFSARRKIAELRGSRPFRSNGSFGLQCDSF
jgi:hypothetical protein